MYQGACECLRFRDRISFHESRPDFLSAEPGIIAYISWDPLRAGEDLSHCSCFQSWNGAGSESSGSSHISVGREAFHVGAEPHPHPRRRDQLLPHPIWERASSRIVRVRRNSLLQSARQARPLESRSFLRPRLLPSRGAGFRAVLFRIIGETDRGVINPYWRRLLRPAILLHAESPSESEQTSTFELGNNFLRLQLFRRLGWRFRGRTSEMQLVWNRQGQGPLRLPLTRQSNAAPTTFLNVTLSSCVVMPRNPKGMRRNIARTRPAESRTISRWTSFRFCRRRTHSGQVQGFISGCFRSIQRINFAPG